MGNIVCSRHDFLRFRFSEGHTGLLSTGSSSLLQRFDQDHEPAQRLIGEIRLLAVRRDFGPIRVRPCPGKFYCRTVVELNEEFLVSSLQHAEFSAQQGMMSPDYPDPIRPGKWKVIRSL